MFWKRAKKVPWWNRYLSWIRSFLISSTTAIAALASLFAYVQLDTTEFRNTTEMVAATDGQFVYVQWDVATKIDENATLLYYLEGEQIGHYHYDGVLPHSFIHSLKIPVDISGDTLDFYAEWRFRGVTTGFFSEGLKFVTRIENATASSNISLIPVKAEKECSNCAFINKLKVGKKIVVTDPLALLEAAKKKQVTRVVKSSLWDIYQYPPVLEELARQNEVSVEELVAYLAEAWREDIFNPFKAIQELPSAIRQLEKILGPEQADRVVEELMDMIIEDLGLEIKRGLEV